MDISELRVICNSPAPAVSNLIRSGRADFATIMRTSLVVATNLSVVVRS